MLKTPRTTLAALGMCLLTTVAASACGGSSNTAESSSSGGAPPTTVQVMMYPGQTYRLPVLIADQQGYFGKAGIKLTTVPQPANITGTQGLTATKSDIGIVATGTLGQGFQAGADVRLFCGGIKVLQTSLMAPNDSKLPATDSGSSPQDVLKSLSGKKIGIQTPVGSGLALVFQSALDNAGVTGYTLVNVGTSETVVAAALKNGSVDAAQTNPTATEQLLTTKTAKRIIYMPDGPPEYKNYYGSGWIASSAWLKSNPKLAAGFCSSLNQALSYIGDNANASNVNSVLQKDTGITADVADLVRKTDFRDFDTKLNTATLDATFQAYTKLGIFKPTPVVDSKSVVEPVQ